MAKYVTILDIARKLGISKSTVSRALSGDTQNVKDETLRKILSTAEQMGYHRNELAVNLRKQSSHNIGIIIPEIITSFYMNFINHVQSFLRKRGYKVIIAVSNESSAQEAENIHMMEQIRVDGILMSVCDKDKNIGLYRKMMERDIPIVFFDRTIENAISSQVRMNDNIMSFFLVEALINQGRKHIVHIPGPSYIRNGYDRKMGYREALEKHQLPYDADYVLPPALSADEGARVMEDFLQRHVIFDAVFGFTETSLLGAKTTLQKHGFRIPEDVALCCMSGTALSTLVHPTITAVEQPVEEMAREASRLLLEHLENGNKPMEDVVLRGETIYRESFLPIGVDLKKNLI